MNGARGDHWNTPQAVIDRVLEMGPIGLDPCSNSTSIVPAAHKLDGSNVSKDGLRLGWSGYGLVYVNPPYSRGLIDQWAEKCCDQGWEHGLSSTEVIGLVPASVGSKWFQQYIFECAAAVCFWSGRLRFLGAPSSARFDSSIVYWGEDVEKFNRVFSKSGKVVIL